MASVKEHYDGLRELGVPRDRARTAAFIDACRDSEREKRENNIDYDEVHVRQSIVHGREDLWLIIDNQRKGIERAEAICGRLNWVVLLLLVIVWELWK